MKKIILILSLIFLTSNAYSNSKFDKDLKKFSKDNGFGTFVFRGIHGSSKHAFTYTTFFPNGN